MRPNRSTAARTAASASARLVTSSLTGSRSFDCPTALDTRSVSRPAATTGWPAARAALATSAPIPRPAPVMNQIFLLLTTSLLQVHSFPKRSMWYAMESLDELGSFGQLGVRGDVMLDPQRGARLFRQ